MASSLARRFMKRLHPEGIPWPMSHVYNALSATQVFQAHYALCVDDVLAQGASGRLLDVGTGPGWLLCHFARRAPGMELYGADISTAMVDKARANFQKEGLAQRVKMEKADAGHLPFADGFFDVVLSTGSMHHWKDPVGGLDELYRVLRKGGTALVYDLVARPPRGVLTEASKKFGKVRIALMWLHSFEEPFYHPQEMEALAQRSLFGQGATRFVGVMCCLELKKP